ncbi:3-methyl-2-oxobutanoate hydroxymethyltransferase [Chthonobacter rhizosphaerae]|uniref:3-methyl-2-oxobutanoate hydroxymethyltransferase n=1 Tax=Chthonobacter rhizosphaerae TaxID=2735553 RepID=UPI0015EE88EE|nr:3-methyl-2-oxobutanoate hydroxymethyltransferase [Chthonobacter rhizosphaerae]
MSAPVRSKRTSVSDIRALKGVRPIVSLTAYTAPMAQLLDPHVDFLLVGDSLGMVIYGLETTLPVTVDMMIAHGAAVVRGSRTSLVIVDLPFGSYQESPEQAFRTAARIIAETGAQGVKLEGGEEMADTIRFLVERGVPVLAHVGLTPQLVNSFGGYRTQGRNQAEAQKIKADATAVAQAGAFAFVLEGTLEPLAREITDASPVPVIGIGASPHCDGQILVSDDMLGLFNEFIPRHVKRYANLGATIGDAAASYAEEVKARIFPALENTFQPKRGG